MKQCTHCLMADPHPFGIYFEDGVCTGCTSLEYRRNNLPEWDDLNLEQLRFELTSVMGNLPDKIIIPFDADGETWFVLDTVCRLGIRPVVVYFNTQYHDNHFFSILSACQEHFDADFIGFSLPKKTIQASISEEFSVGSGHCRNLEIYARHASALFAAEHLGIKDIIVGPHQQSEQVGSHSSLVRNQLKGPGFTDIVIGKNLLPQVRTAIVNVGSKFSQTFRLGVVESMLERSQWHFLSDYIFWDSESINGYYAIKFEVSPRVVNGFGASWQSSSSSLKLEFFDLLRLISTGTSKIDSYLSRDIRFGRITKQEANDRRSEYLNKSWDLEGIAEFLGITHRNAKKAVELYQKKRAPKYQPQSLNGSHEFHMTSHNQQLR